MCGIRNAYLPLSERYSVIIVNHYSLASIRVGGPRALMCIENKGFVVECGGKYVESVSVEERGGGWGDGRIL